MRVYLDTNIYSEVFKNRDIYLRFKAAKKQGRCQFVGSFEIIQEILNHRSNLAEARQIFRRYEEIASPSLFSNEPSSLIIQEINDEIRSVDHDCYMSGSEGRRFLEIVWSDFEKTELEDICQTFLSGKKAAHKKNIERNRQERTIIQIDPKLSFPAFWENTLKLGAGPALGAVCKSYGLEVPQSKIQESLGRLDKMRAAQSSLIIVLGQMYRQLLKSAYVRPHRNDTIDARHVILAAYADVFLTVDTPFRATLDTCSGLLPFRVLSPEEFLSELERIY